MMSLTTTILLYLAFCLIGAGFELGFGIFWSIVGTTPWIYPNSFLHYTSLEGIPLWGFAGFITVAVYRASKCRSVRPLLTTIPLLILITLWILFCSCFIQ